MNLTAKQESFAQAVAGGMSQADAYRSAYDTKAAAKTVQENASRLMADSKVAARVKKLQAITAEKSLWTRLDSVQALAAIAHDVEARASEKVSAIKELNAMHGFNEPQKIDLLNSDGSMRPSIIQIVPLHAISADSSS